MGRRKKKAETRRYEIRSSVRVFNAYTNKGWAEHSAECYAGFFDTSVEVFDTIGKIVLCTKFPRTFKEAKQ